MPGKVYWKNWIRWATASVIIPTDATPTGNVEGYEDAVKCAKYFKQHADQIDGIVVVLANFGDELGVVNTIQMADLNVPVLIMACDDDNDKVGVKERRDAFCGKLSVCNNLYQYGIKFTDTTYHTYSLDSKEFTADLYKFAGICRVVKGMKGLRVGAIGTRPIGFQTMRVSEKILQKTGITVVPVDMSEILAAADKIDENSCRCNRKGKGHSGIRHLHDPAQGTDFQTGQVRTGSRTMDRREQLSIFQPYNAGNPLKKIMDVLPV